MFSCKAVLHKCAVKVAEGRVKAMTSDYGARLVPAVLTYEK